MTKQTLQENQIQSSIKDLPRAALRYRNYDRWRKKRNYFHLFAAIESLEASSKVSAMSSTWVLPSWRKYRS